VKNHPRECKWMIQESRVPVVQKVPVLQRVAVVQRVPIVQRVPDVQAVERFLVSPGLAQGRHRSSLFSAGSFWPTLPTRASVPTRQHPLCVDHPNVRYCFFDCTLPRPTEQGKYAKFRRQSCQSPSRSLLTPRGCTLYCQQCRVAVLETGPWCVTWLHPIVVSYLLTASGLQAMSM